MVSMLIKDVAKENLAILYMLGVRIEEGLPGSVK